MVGDQRLVADLDHRQLVVEPLGVGEAQARPRPARTRPRCAPSRSAQKASESSEPTRQTIRWTMPAPARPGGDAGELEEGEVGAGAALLVGEEEVVDGRVVLVDGLLDQAQAQHARVEVDVALRVLGDRRDVVNSLELHRVTYSILSMSRGRRRTVKALVALGSVLAFLSVFAIWVERQALNTDDWVNTSGKLLQNSTDPQRRRQLPGRTALRKRQRRAGTERHPPRRNQAVRRPALGRAAAGGRRWRRTAAEELDRPEPLGRRQPDLPRTARRGAGRKGRNRLHRRTGR